MSDFKIGDKVKYKYGDEFLGYVSHVFKGHLFSLDDPEVRVHNKGIVTIVNSSNLEKYDDIS